MIFFLRLQFSLKFVICPPLAVEANFEFNCNVKEYNFVVIHFCCVVILKNLLVYSEEVTFTRCGNSLS